MEDPVETARRILSRHPGPALPYTELHHLVSFESSGPAPRHHRLLRRIRARTDLFRILDPKRGPWRLLDAERPDSASPATRPTNRNRRRDWLEPWILLGPSEGAGETPGPDVSFPLVRESVLILGRTLDAASTPSLARWLLIAREEQALRARIVAERSARRG